MKPRWTSVVLSLVFAGSIGGGLSAQEDTNSPACPASLPSASFIDIGRLPDETTAAVACLLHYGITTGTSPTTFSPESPVTRSQMARFLARTIAAVEVEVPDGEDAPFEDMHTVNEEGQRAISRLWRLGITRGTGSATFDPETPVARRQMALFLARLLKAADIPAEADRQAPSYTDLGDASAEVVEAVGYLAGLGVEWPGASASGSFEPARNVTRDEMALLLAASLEAGKARPVRLEMELSAERSITSGAVVAEVTVTKPNGDPYPGLLLDVFVSPFLYHDGRCIVDGDARINGGDGGTSSDCRIDRADPRTDSDGKVRVGLAHAPVPETDRIYAWVGRIGQEYVETVPDQVWADLVWYAGPNRVHIDEIEDEQEFGTRIDIKSRLFGDNIGGQRLIMVVFRQGAPVYTQGSTTAYDGGARFSYIGPRDPSAADNNPEQTEKIKVFWDRNGNGAHDGPAELFSEITVIWDDR